MYQTKLRTIIVTSVFLFDFIMANHLYIQDLGVITPYDDSEIAWVLPTFVKTGEPFDVTVKTFGDTCVAARRLDVEIQDFDLILRPIDVLKLHGSCFSIGNTYPRTVQLNLNDVGVYTVFLEGYKRNLFNEKELIRLKRFLIVIK